MKLIMSKHIDINQQEYGKLLQQAVDQIRNVRTQIAKQINSAAQSVYWYLGKLLYEKQLEEGYGSGVVNQLSVDLKKEFPDLGLSPRNLCDMKRFYERYHQAHPKLLQAVPVLLWVHNLLLINEVLSLEATEFYANEAVSQRAGREIALQDINKPIGVSEYQLLLPKDKLQALLTNELNNNEENESLFL